MQFKLWLETSYAQSDVPETFYVVGDFTPESASQLASFTLPGIVGISGDQRIIRNFMGVARDMMIVMDGFQVEKQNRMTRVMYNNPEYLVSNNMAALKRIWSRQPNAPNRRIYQNIIDYLRRAGQVLRKNNSGERIAWSIDYDGGFHVGKNFPEMVKNSWDIARWLEQAAKHPNWNIKNFTLQDAHTIVLKALELIGEVYHDEGEWILKDKRLSIPQQSQVYLLVPTVEKDKWTNYLDTQKAPYWERGDLEKMYNLLELLHKNDLFKKYEMFFLPATEYNKIGLDNRNLQSLQSIARKYPVIGY